MKKVLVIALIALAFGCKSEQPKVTPIPKLITDSYLCGEACANLKKLGCEEGEPVPDGTKCMSNADCNIHNECVHGMCMSTCELFCQETQSWGVWLDPMCVSKITSCNGLEQCPQGIE